MPKMIKQANLPYKICARCGRPFGWRKKWEKNWDQVKYCSGRCSNKRKPGSGAGAGTAEA